MGYSQAELDLVQERWGLRFPSDLVALLKEHRPLLGDQNSGAFDWLLTDPAAIQARLDWPFESFWFDVKNNVAWWPEWGRKPTNAPEQFSRLKQVFQEAPRLIPLYGHRYLPEEPFEIGNPVFSVYQTDVIYYGANLYDWLECERSRHKAPLRVTKEIRFWSEAVRRNGMRPTLH